MLKDLFDYAIGALVILAVGMFLATETKAADPSAWSVVVEVQETAFAWDYVKDANFFAYGQGVFLYMQNPDGSWTRVAYAEQYPQGHPSLGGLSPRVKLVNDALEAFNGKLDAMFPDEGDEHPVNQEMYEYLLRSLIFDEATERFVDGR